MKWRWKLAQAVEIRWWKNYLGKQSPSLYLEKKKAYWERVLNTIDLKLKPGETVLDAGCGPAGIFMVLPEQKVDAVDTLLDQYEGLDGFFRKADYPYVIFHASTLEGFPSDKQYDTVFCLNAINHVENIEKGMDRLVELTRIDGRLIISVDAHNYSFFKHLFRLIPGDILHPHQYNVSEYKQMLLDRSCQIDQCVRLKKQFFFDYYIISAKKSNHG